MKKAIITLIILSFQYLNAFENGDFDGEDSAWTTWIVGGDIEINLNYTDNGPAGGSGEALRIHASNWGNGGVYQPINLEENILYEVSGLFKGIGCNQNWVEISILEYEPQEGVDIGTNNIIVEQHFWHCGAGAPWNWDTEFSNSCGSNSYSPGSPPGFFTVQETGIYYFLIKSGGVVSDVIFDNLNLEIIDDDLPETNWVLVWSDEFSGTEIDESKWSYDIGTGDWGWGNGEAQYYTSNSSNSFIEDGKLVIQALQQNYGGANYTSARMVTRDQGDWTYGRVEVRAKLPSGIGTWPAIWMLPTDWVYGGWPYSGEIDIMEHVGFDPNVIHGTAHTEDYNWWNGIPPPSWSIYTDGATSDFHDYTLEWDEDYLKWYVDGIHYFTYANDQAGDYATWPFDQRFHLLLNIAIGGTWGGQQGIDDSIFPVRLEVDYVRVYEQSTAPMITLTHTSGWNMIGAPLITQNMNYNEVFPESVTGSLYSYNETYLNEDILVPGTGYWLNFYAEGSSAIQGEPIAELTIELTEGWNLISGISDEISIGGIIDLEDIIVEGTIYQFQEAYVNAEMIEPGEAYWIYSNADGAITISSTNSIRTLSKITDHTERANILSINGRNLYFGVSIPEEEVLNYHLPPKPPKGAFDVRFSNNMKVAENSGAIKIMNSSPHLVIHYDIKDNSNWILTGIQEYRISDYGEIIVSGDVSEFTLNKDIEIPLVYSVSQNYPNPFNPKTTISYELPEHSNVSIIIYDLLGQTVKTLVNKYEEPGFKFVTWGGTDNLGKPVTAGLYIYQIKADSFIAVRKMALLK